MKILIESFNAFNYVEVHRITAWRKHKIYKTENTYKCINADQIDYLDKSKYTTASFSTELTRQPTFTIDLVGVNDL